MSAPSTAATSSSDPASADSPGGITTFERVETFLSPRNLLIAWILLFQLLALVYAPAFRSPFIYDDLPNIVFNEDFRADRPLVAILATHSSSLQFDHRPVSGIVTWLNFVAFGLNVSAFRAVNLLIHWLCSGVLGLVAAHCAQRCGMRMPRLFAALLAAVWALHPIHSSAVIYISQRMESLMTLFFLVSCACLLQSHPSRRSSPFWRIASALAACLCLLSKENGAGLPLVLVVLDRLFVAGSWRKIWSRERTFYLFLLVAWISLGVWILKGPRVAEWDDIPALASPWRYFQTECHVVFGYLRLLLWPTPLVFAPAPRIAETWVDWLPYLAALLAVFGGLAWEARRRAWLWLPWLTILVVLAPTSSFIPVPLEPAFDYRMHLPAAAAVALVLIAGWSIARRLALPATWLLNAAAASMLALGVVTRFRAEDYARPESIWMDVVRKEPENIKAWFNLCYYFLSRDRPEEARFAAEAAHNANQVFHLPWIDAEYHRMLGLLAEKGNNWTEAETQFRAAMSHAPGVMEFRAGRARALLKLGRPQEALEILEPPGAGASNNWETDLWRAIALARLGEIRGSQGVCASVLPTAIAPWQAVPPNRPEQPQARLSSSGIPPVQ